MKKKYLKSLKAMEKWLFNQVGENSALDEAFKVILTGLESLPDEEVGERPLPPPAELNGDSSILALYSDGGCRGNPGPGAFAYVVQDHEGQVVVEGMEYESRTTNNKMELSGPLNGLHELLKVLPAKGVDPLLTRVKIITDSKYVVDGMKSWVQGWKLRDWKKADGKAPENLELWQNLDQVKDRFMQVEWMWIKGHAGHPQNEYCDRKANELMDANTAD